ncbi:sensor histidine kinase [Vallitalea okinawensis]|uniref:sensor histidine kinase n=1 Tax=Vallitalea okinawensis TaxID=2078660 RepID=UPI000CFCD7A0|nr:sensor histidine kinase [Vallitalea okinawensis]
MKLHSKILITLIMISLMPLLIVVTFYDNSAQEIVNDNVSVYFEQLVKRNGSYLDLKLNELEKSINSTVGNNIIQSALFNYNELEPIERVDSWIQVKKVINPAFALNEELKSAIIYLYDGKIEIYGEQYPFELEESSTKKYITFFRDFFENEFEASEAYEKIQEMNYRPVWFYNFYEGDQRLYLMREIVNYNYGGQPIGIIAYAVDIDILIDAIEETHTGNGETVFIIDENNAYVVTEDDKVGAICTESYLNKLDNQNGGILVEDGHMIAYSQLRNGWKLISQVPMENFTKDMAYVRNFTVLIGFICIFIAIVISILFSRYIAVRFKALISCMELVENGNFEIGEQGKKLNKEDELSIIFRHFFRMVDRIKALINNNYIQEIEKKEAQLNALQYQINPHFLYNTLEVINAMAKVKECEEIGQVSQTLGDLFRYNMNRTSSDVVALREEIDHIKNYIYLQNIHHNNSIEVFYDFTDKHLDLRIQRFILQPIIENAIKYGFKPRGGYGCIEISGQMEEENFIISIQDDGIGIPIDRLEIINSDIQLEINDSHSSESIGLRNINQRIKLAFGTEYGIKIQSVYEMGTTVDIILPIINGGE